MMDLVDENRLYVKYALESLKDSRNPGLNALMRLSGRNEKKISTYDLGFLIGPCINAAGRLGDAKQSLEFLLERDPNVAEARARELLAVNNERKSMTEAGVRHITDMLETATVNGEFGQAATLADKVLVVYIPTVHESVVGIIASRLKEAYTRPVMVFTDAETPGILKGSGRSIDSYNMFEELNRFREMFTAFGGHAMAAGFSIEKERLDELRRKINEAAVLTDEDITPKLMIDVAMPLAYNSIELTEQIERLEPYGKGNRKPLFAQAAVPVRMAQILGRNKNLLKLQLDTGYGRCVDAIDFDPDTFVNNIKQWFGEDECVKMLNGQPNAVVIDVAYYPTIKEGDEGGVSIGGASLWALNNNDDVKAAATWKFIKFLISPESQAYWNAQTGYFPVTTAAYDEQTFKDNVAQYPQFQTAIDQLHDSKPQYAGALLSVFPEARQIVETEIENMINGSKTPEQAVDSMASQINSSIEDYNLLNE